MSLARLHIEYPMLFKIVNEGANRHSHCGVLEFSAPEGSCFMPYWVRLLPCIYLPIASFSHARLSCR